MEDNLFDDFPEEIREGLFDIVESLLNTRNPIVRMASGSKKGDNFMGIVYRLTCSAQDGSREYSFFIKVAPTDEIRRQMFHTNECFMREIFVYEEVLPFLRQFQESRGVYSGGFVEYSKCYKTFSTQPTECLILEDMTQQNFVMVDKMNVMVENILLVMKTLGKLHAISFAAKDQEPDKFFDVVNKLNEIFFITGIDSVLSFQINKAENLAIDCITDDDDAHLVKALLDLYETSQYNQMAEMCDGSTAEPYSVILHGDMWSNNTMFKYHENILQDICFIDWQVTRYGSPVLDLMYYIFSATTRETRGRNYNIYLKTYHESLSNMLSRLGSDPEKLFPYSALQDQLRKFGKFGLINATFLLPIITAEIDGLNLNENKTNDGLSVGFKKRFRDIVADVFRLGYIQTPNNTE